MTIVTILPTVVCQTEDHGHDSNQDEETESCGDGMRYVASGRYVSFKILAKENMERRALVGER